MTFSATDQQSDLAHLEARVVTAALRAAYAWAERERHPGAMREIARMTGVVMEAHGPGRGPNNPVALIEELRHPLRSLLGFADDPDSAIADAVLLDESDRLADAAYDIATEYAHNLTPTVAGDDWLPSWTRMRAEQVVGRAFTAMVEAGDPARYVLARRFVVEHPAGCRVQVMEDMAAAGAPCVTKYGELSPDQQYQGDGRSWWWPCPVCRWPMSVAGQVVRCRYRPHRAVYQVVPGRSGKMPPRLVRIAEHGSARAPAPSAVEDAVCVEAAIWRHIVVPGATELRIANDLARLGANVSLWPDLDSYDLHVAAGAITLRLDVKEYRSVRRLIATLRDKPPCADLLVPKGHEYQRELILHDLPAVRVFTEAEVRRKVKQAVGRPA